MSNNIQQKILEKIEKHELVMRPKFYFTLKVVALVLVVLLTILTSVFFISFMLFSIRASSQFALLGFGMRGLLMFVLLFPWWWLVADVALIIVLEWLIRQFRFGYKHSVVFLFTGIVIVVASVGFLVERTTRFHEGLLSAADHHRLPIFGEMYEHIHRPPPHERGICRCVVTAISGNDITLEDDNPEFGTTTELHVMLPPEFASTSIQVGDRVFVAGDIIGGQVRPFGIQKLDDMK